MIPSFGNKNKDASLSRRLRGGFSPFYRKKYAKLPQITIKYRSLLQFSVKYCKITSIHANLPHNKNSFSDDF